MGTREDPAGRHSEYERDCHMQASCATWSTARDQRFGAPPRTTTWEVVSTQSLSLNPSL